MSREPEHSAGGGGRFAQVLAQYQRLEPDGTDTWNPAVRPREMIHRVALYEELCVALEHRSRELERLRVLDVGCGVGRSTRVYLDFGLPPEHLVGVDLRAGAIALARRSHPAIRFLAYDGERLPFDDHSFDWVSVCTVLSSIAGDEPRAHVVAEMQRVLVPGGRLFFWDLAEAHAYADGAVLEPQTLFSGMELLADRLVCPWGTPQRALVDSPEVEALLPRLRELSMPRTHRASVLERR